MLKHTNRLLPLNPLLTPSSPYDTLSSFLTLVVPLLRTAHYTHCPAPTLKSYPPCPSVDEHSTNPTQISNIPKRPRAKRKCRNRDRTSSGAEEWTIREAQSTTGDSQEPRTKNYCCTEHEVAYSRVIVEHLCIQRKKYWSG